MFFSFVIDSLSCFFSYLVACIPAIDSVLFVGSHKLNDGEVRWLAVCDGVPLVRSFRVGALHDGSLVRISFHTRHQVRAIHTRVTLHVPIGINLNQTRIDHESNKLLQ